VGLRVGLDRKARGKILFRQADLNEVFSGVSQTKGGTEFLGDKSVD
jgi:hypothetical protein